MTQRKAKAVKARSLENQPQKIDAETWFYDDEKGLLVVHEARTANGDYLKTDQFIIKWPLLEAALQRHAPVSGRRKP